MVCTTIFPKRKTENCAHREILNILCMFSLHFLKLFSKEWKLLTRVLAFCFRPCSIAFSTSFLIFQTQTKASKILGDQSPKLDFTHLVPTCDRHGHWIALGKLPMATHGGRHLPHFKRHNRKFTYQCFTNKMRRKQNTHIIHKEIREIRYNLSNEREYTHSSSSSNMKVFVCFLLILLLQTSNVVFHHISHQFGDIERTRREIP